MALTAPRWLRREPAPQGRHVRVMPSTTVPGAAPALVATAAQAVLAPPPGEGVPGPEATEPVEVAPVAAEPTAAEPTAAEPTASEPAAANGPDAAPVPGEPAELVAADGPEVAPGPLEPDQPVGPVEVAAVTAVADPGQTASAAPVPDQQPPLLETPVDDLLPVVDPFLGGEPLPPSALEAPAFEPPPWDLPAPSAPPLPAADPAPSPFPGVPGGRYEPRPVALEFSDGARFELDEDDPRFASFLAAAAAVAGAAHEPA